MKLVRRGRAPSTSLKTISHTFFLGKMISSAKEEETFSGVPITNAVETTGNTPCFADEEIMSDKTAIILSGEVRR